VAEIARRLDATLATLLLLFAARFRILGVLTNPVWTHFHVARERLARLLGHLAAGRLPRRRPQPVANQPAPPRTPPLRPRLRVPSRRRGWLGFLLDYNVRSAAMQIGALLRQPGVPETLARSPGIARTLRPLCHMLGVELPPALRLPPRPPRPSPDRPPRATPQHQPAAPPPPPGPPLQRYVQDAARAWMTPAEKREARKNA
jgi:hypothetical protein